MSKKEELSAAIEYLGKAFDSHIAGKIKNAIDDYKKSIEIYPTAKAYTYLGSAYSLLGKYEEAIENCKKAIEFDSHYGNPYYDIGIYLINLNRLDEAILWFDKALNIANYEPKYLPYFNSGKIYEKKGDWLQALKFYKKALAQNPDYEPAQKALIKITTLLN